MARSDRRRMTIGVMALLVAVGVVVRPDARQAPAGGQARPTSQTQAPFTFRAAVDVIQVDVSVLDRNGAPVRGLAAADFTVLENGKPQEVVAFTSIDVASPPDDLAPWLRDTRPDVRDNDLAEGRLFAIILDDATLPPDVRMASEARRAARQVVERLGPRDLAAVIFVMNGRRSVDFTNDRRRLLQAIDALTPSFAFADQLAGTERFLHFASIRTLGLVAQHLSVVPLRRKAIVYVSTGVPVDIEAAGTVRLPERGTPPLGESSDETALEIDAARDLLEAVNDALATRPQETFGAAVQEAFVRAQHGNVNIYTIDPAGLGGMQAFLEARVRTGNTLPGPLNTPASAFQTARLHRDFLRGVAENSGGRAIVNSNDLERGVTQIFRENSSYYLVGYRSTTPPDDRRVRRVDVRVSRPGVVTRTRNAYFNPTARTRVLDVPLSTRLTDALAGVVPVADVALSATAAPFPLPGRRQAAVAVVLGVRQPGRPGDVGSRVEDTIALLTRAFTPNGDPRGSARQTARVVMRSGLADEVAVDVLSRIDLPPGRYQLRLAADSALSGRSGSVFVDVDVPDFTRAPLALSGVVITADPGFPAAPRDALAGLFAVVPTTQRAFTADDRAVALVQVTQAGLPRSAVSMTGTVTNADNTVVSRTTETVPVEAFADGQIAAWEYGLPLTRLAAGRYLLTIEARRGARTATRDVWFSVR